MNSHKYTHIYTHSLYGNTYIGIQTDKTPPEYRYGGIDTHNYMEIQIQVYRHTSIYRNR